MEAGSLRWIAEGLIMDTTLKGPMNFGASFLDLDFRGMSLAVDQVCTVGLGHGVDPPGRSFIPLSKAGPHEY